MARCRLRCSTVEREVSEKLKQHLALHRGSAVPTLFPELHRISPLNVIMRFSPSFKGTAPARKRGNAVLNLFLEVHAPHLT